MKINLKTLALALAMASPAAMAATHQFSGVINFSAATPSLVGEAIAVEFSYSDAAAALAGADGSVDLLSLDVSFLGQTYHLGQAVDAYAQFEGGLLIGPNAGFANVLGGDLQLQSFFGSSGFTYSRDGLDSIGELSVSAVPEPSSWALSLVGILAIGAVVRRRTFARG